MAVARLGRRLTMPRGGFWPITARRGARGGGATVSWRQAAAPGRGRCLTPADEFTYRRERKQLLDSGPCLSSPWRGARTGREGRATPGVCYLSPCPALASQQLSLPSAGHFQRCGYSPSTMVRYLCVAMRNMSVYFLVIDVCTIVLRVRYVEKDADNCLCYSVS